MAAFLLPGFGQALAFEEGAVIGIGPPAKVPPKLEPVKAEPAAICGAIALQARRFGLSPDFFARLIFQESRFDANAVSPKGAAGIAQFMPATARERGLADPFDIASALYHSASYLREHWSAFGNWGLAAAAYNAGPNRVRRWLAGTSGLPAETRGFVAIITGEPAETFREAGAELGDLRLDAELSFLEACEKLPVRRTSLRLAALDSGAWQPWGAQVAGSHSRQAALSAFTRLKARYGAAIGEDAPMVVRARSPARGRAAIYAVRLGAPSRKEAGAICARLRQKGGACLVMKNPARGS
ncbi:lytic transglycosylase domain-containing protein [Afifella pfennigii]|uniref:lytic transglycosylase domain-containing protein n=1 Tax=Afifella pfennigii TaxID=209897 RepID=UPI000ABC28F8|nr:transglycosylase SLT domain-containing protein [Afifella pfennigii]